MTWRQEFFYEHLFDHPRIPQTEGIRNLRWKYTRYLSIEPVYEELFDLRSDPAESQNLAERADMLDRLQTLRNRCSQWVEKLQ